MEDCAYIGNVSGADLRELIEQHVPIIVSVDGAGLEYLIVNHINFSVRVDGEVLAGVLGRMASAMNIGKVSSAVDPDLISRKEAATILGRSLNTLYNWSEAGMLTRHKIGGNVYYSKTEVMKLIKTKTI